MKKAVVFLNGKIKIKSEFYKQYTDSRIYDYYCADGGANYAFQLGVMPKLIIGDLDSIDRTVENHFKNNNVNFHKYPKSKDFTDGELIIERIYKKYNEIIILGGHGGRTDHFLSNLFLVEKYPKIKFINHLEEMFLIESGYKFKNKVGTTISFIPMDNNIKKINLTGFEYPLTDYNLKRGSTITMSNIINADHAKITFKSGKLLAIINYK